MICRMAVAEKISIVVPCYNEEGSLPEFYNQIAQKLSDNYELELLFVDDGSIDNTVNVIKRLSDKDKRVKYLILSKNFGHQNALKAGYDMATGDAVICMDADLQHPVEIIPNLIRLWKDGYHVVYTKRIENIKTSFFKKLSSRWFYEFMSRLSEIKISSGTADFRLLDRRVVDELKALNENHLFFRGLIPWVGFKQIGIEYHAQERYSGVSKYTFMKMVKLASAGITAFSTKPLKLSIMFGLFIASISFVYILYALWVHFFTDEAVTGWTSLIISVLFMGGIQLIMIGILGEYLGKLFMENKRRPNYIIMEKNI